MPENLEPERCFTQYSAQLRVRIWVLDAVGPGGIERKEFDSLAAMTAWVGFHMAETYGVEAVV